MFAVTAATQLPVACRTGADIDDICLRNHSLNKHLFFISFTKGAFNNNNKSNSQIKDGYTTEPISL